VEGVRHRSVRRRDVSRLIGMKKLRVLMVMTLLALLGAVIVPPVASADGDGSCNIFDPSCTVGTGGGGGRGSGGGSGGSTTDPCARYPNAAYGSKPPAVSQACADELQARYCNAMVGDAADGLEKAPAKWTLAETEAVNAEMAKIGCPPVVTPAGLAEQAVKTITFPHPSGDRSPSQTLLYRGYPFTYVGLWTFWWTSPATWKMLTATASAAGFTATVTARPVQLIYDPGDGSSAVSCAGPGRPWTEADGDGPPTGGACAYQYTKVTGSPITPTQSIVWKITWTGTGGSAGEIPQLVTSTSGQLNVMQIQTVVTR
jgi:hypothetical protein